jgi:hypothetical protein
MAEAVRATFNLEDGMHRDVSREQVERVAATLEEGDGTVLEAHISDRHIEVMPLMVKLLDVPPDRLRRSQAVDLLRALRFAMVGETEQFAESPVRPDAVSMPDRETENDLAPVDVTPRLAIALQRYGGKWVALRDGAVVTDAPTLPNLMTALGGAGATVLFVPPRGAARSDTE